MVLALKALRGPVIDPWGALHTRGQNGRNSMLQIGTQLPTDWEKKQAPDFPPVLSLPRKESPARRQTHAEADVPRLPRAVYHHGGSNFAPENITKAWKHPWGRDPPLPHPTWRRLKLKIGPRLAARF